MTEVRADAPTEEKWRVMVVYGTRPEAIKVAPVVNALRDTTCFAPFVVATQQHHEIVSDVEPLLGLHPDVRLSLNSPASGLASFVGAATTALAEVLDTHMPDAVLVQGDTSSAFAAALAAYYGGIPVIHLEAGLRAREPGAPFPEEHHRRIIGVLASLHLAPTEHARANLLREGVDAENIDVIGNTVIDSLRSIERTRPALPSDIARMREAYGRLVTVTMHRRESWGGPLTAVADAVATVALSHSDACFVIPVHPNPIIGDAFRAALRHCGNVSVVDALRYDSFVALLCASDLVMTDSGGVQEECASLGKPVMVLRSSTERSEVLDAGIGVLVGTDSDAIRRAAADVLSNAHPILSRAQPSSVYGVGGSADLAIDAITRWFARPRSAARRELVAWR